MITADEYHFHVPEAGDYRVCGGREIIVAPAPTAGKREVRLFLLGSAWGALSYQRGILALHASAVYSNNGAVIFCGHTGSGKSTVAAWLIDRGGYRFTGDDLCCLEISDDGHPLVYPTAPRLKLWQEALIQFGISEKELERDHFRQEKYHVALPAEETRQFLPLTGICLLGWGETRLTRLTGISALRRFVAAATYRGYLLEPMGQIAAHWERCIELVKRVPVWEFQRPKDWSEMERAMNLLLTDMRI